MLIGAERRIVTSTRYTATSNITETAYTVSKVRVDGNSRMYSVMPLTFIRLQLQLSLRQQLRLILSLILAPALRKLLLRTRCQCRWVRLLSEHMLMSFSVVDTVATLTSTSVITATQTPVTTLYTGIIGNAAGKREEQTSSPSSGRHRRNAQLLGNLLPEVNLPGKYSVTDTIEHC